MTHEDVDWMAYKEELSAAIDNEHMWMLGALCESDFNMHKSNAERLKNELDMLEHGKQEDVYSMYDERVWIDFMELINN